MEKPSALPEGETRFCFHQGNDALNSTEAKPIAILIPPEQLETVFWPQSYERSMSFYSRSPLMRQISSNSNMSESAPWEGATHKPMDLDEPLLNGERYRLDTSCGADQMKRQLHSSGHLSQSKSSTFQAILNGMNILAGVGILSMPYAVAEGGWIGLIFLLLFAAVCCYTGVLLRRCLDSDPQLLGYPDVGQAAFGRLGRALVSGMLYFELFAVAVEFLILEGDNLTQLVPWGGFSYGDVQISSESSFIILSALVMLPTVWLRDLSMLSYISAGGVAACVVVFMAVAWVGIFDTGFHYRGHLLSGQGFPIALGLYAFCYCGHAVFPNIYNSMREKEKFSSVLITCFVLCTFIYGGMAVLGFLMFGDNVKSQITLNLPKGSIVTTVAIIATLVNPFAKYALTVTPLGAALEELLPLRWRPQAYIWGATIRTFLVASTAIIALTVPFFAYLMALVGSFLSTTVAIIIPCLCYLKLFSGRLSVWERARIYIFIALGLVACVAGTYSSLREIVSRYSVY